MLIFLLLGASWFASSGAVNAQEKKAIVTKGTAIAPTEKNKKAVVSKLPLVEWTVVAAQKGWLKEEFGKYNSTVELVDVGKVAGVEASLLDRGDMHFAFRMQYPSLQHKLNGLDCVVVWQSKDAPPRRNTIVALKDNSSVNTIADLKGKNLGSWRISCPYFSAYEVLNLWNTPLDTDLHKGDVRFVNITGTAQTSAFLAGKLDAISVHPGANTYSALYTQGLVKEVSASITNGVYLRGGGRTSWFADRKFTLQHPELVVAFLTAYEKTRHWVVENPEAASTIIARELRLPRHVADYVIRDNSSYSFVDGTPSYDDAVNSIKLFQKWGIENGDDFLIKKSLTDKQIEAFIDKRFFEGGEYFVDTSGRRQPQQQALLNIK